MRSLGYLRDDWAKVVLSGGRKKISETRLSSCLLDEPAAPGVCNPSERSSGPRGTPTQPPGRGPFELSLGTVNSLSHSPD